MPLRLGLLLLGLAGCGYKLVEDSAQPEDCTLGGRLDYVADRMHGEYLWAEFSPLIEPVGYASPEVYLADHRYEALDRWSYAKDLSEATAYWEEGAYLGVGMRMIYDHEGFPVVSLVYPDGPAGQAGLSRGDRVLALNSVAMEDITSSAEWDAAYGPRDEGAEVVYTVEGLDGEVRDVTVVLSEVITPPLLGSRVFELDGRVVGYFMLTSFVEPADPALDTLFESFAEAGVDTVFIDLRYNGGGLIAVARHLAGLLLPGHDGEVFQHYIHNTEHADADTFTELEAHDHAIAVDSVVVFTTGDTASASEMLAFALEPYLPVHRVGSKTVGKPVGMEHFEMCDLFVAPITFQVANRDEPAEWFGGMAPHCEALDDLTTTLGGDTDPMVQGAATVLSGGDCVSLVSRGTPNTAMNRHHTDPWTAMTGW